jgi:putative ATPase
VAEDADLFAHAAEGRRKRGAPLADRMRPRSIDEIVGQPRLLGPGTFFRRLIESGEVPSIIFWGPPGSGKTTLARLLAMRTGKKFVQLSAVTSGIKDVRETAAAAGEALKYEQRGTILFLDEIHRFNKAQQDALLPHVEAGTITLVGATTENPSFEVIAPLLSRAKVLVLEPLSDDDVIALLRRALCDEERGLGKAKVGPASASGAASLRDARPAAGAVPGSDEFEVEDDALKAIAGLAGGDARAALNLLELATMPKGRVTRAVVEEAAQRKDLKYDKAGEQHFNIISALHKSLRGSDPDAALYWMGRMLEAGEDPLYVARRLVRFASEDVGLADPQALPQALAAFEAARVIGMPECDCALAQACVYLALAPKSNALVHAYGLVKEDIRQERAYPVPLHIRNAPTPLMKALGYGERYRYSHEEPGAIGTQSYLPPELAGRRYYEPTPRGAEAELGRRVAWIRAYREAARRAGEAPPPAAPPPPTPQAP